MLHVACGGTVNTESAYPCCDKCGWSIKAVEKDNTRQAAKPDVKDKPWWNTKRFKTERDALTYSSDKAHEVYLEANALWVETGKKPFDAKAYDKVKKLYQRAAETAKTDDDLVTYAILDSMQAHIEQAAKEHQAAEANG